MSIVWSILTLGDTPSLSSALKYNISNWINKENEKRRGRGGREEGWEGGEGKEQKDTCKKRFTSLILMKFRSSPDDHIVQG